nr:uncharacterized protein LOC113807774 [Penaeus vannamei]
MSSWELLSSRWPMGTYALVDVYSSAVGRAMQYERRGERCRFYLGKEPVKVDLDVFVFAKNSPILFQIDDTIRWLKYFGVIQHIKKNYYSVPCEVEVTSNAPEPMSLLQGLRCSQGAFYVLGAGLALATASFLLEVAWRAFVRREDDQVAWRTFGRNEGYPGP